MSDDRETSDIIHIWGFGERGIGASILDGSLADVANRTLDKVRACGHDVKVSTVRDLSGWLVEVHATVTVDPAHPMWHRFISPKDAWPMADSEAKP